MQKITHLLLILTFFNLNAQQIPDPDQGLRADWLRGSYGLNWKPENSANGHGERQYIDSFLEQISGLRSLDYIQVHLGESYTTSSVHLAPHTLLESFWEGDTDAYGSPLNLVVPRAIINRDPFLDMLKAIKAEGLKTQVYVNSSNLLLRFDINNDVISFIDNPDDIPNITERWKLWCDTNVEAQTFINSQTYHTDIDWPNRQYMFCYAEYILKEYAIRYGDLIDSWLFDTGKMMYLLNGDDRYTGQLDDQRIYQAFTNAIREGNPDVSVSFNNSQGEKDLVSNPWAPATLFDDYMFGHPFNGGNNVGSNIYNEFLLTWSNQRSGNAHLNDLNETRTWDDNVIAHFDPPLSATSWNGGTTAGVTDAQIVDWYGNFLINGGAISLGVPLVSQINYNNLLCKDFGMDQLYILDAYLLANESTGKPNWSRQETVLPEAYTGENYYHELQNGVDFWDTEGDAITEMYTVTTDTSPSWLTITQSIDNSDIWILSGLVTDVQETNYNFRLRVKEAVSGGTNRYVTLNVKEEVPIPSSTVQVKATENTNYGIGQVATMISDVQTAPDGLATYQIQLEVTPPIDKAIVSGNGGGDSTDYAWGIGLGTTDTSDKIFNGDEFESVDSVDNVSIVNFQANGSDLQVSQIIFESISIRNAQSAHDGLKLDFNNGIVRNITNVFSDLEDVDYGIESMLVPVTSFKFGTSENVVDITKNKWSVEGLNFSVYYTKDAFTLSTEDTTVDDKPSLLIIPNPVNSTFSINIDALKTDIYDINGRLLISFKAGVSNFNISSFSSGIYFVNVLRDNGQIMVSKLIKN